MITQERELRSPLIGIYGSRLDEPEIMAISAYDMACEKEDSGAEQKIRGIDSLARLPIPRGQSLATVITTFSRSPLYSNGLW